MNISRAFGTILFTFILSIFSIFVLSPKKRATKKKGKVISRTGQPVVNRNNMFV